LYAATTSIRSKPERSRPSGKASTTWRKSAAGRMSNRAPIVKRASTWVSCKADGPLAKPPAIISGPRRLSGRRNHATSPARMYGTVIQSSNATDTRSTSSLVSATAIERRGAMQPTAATAASRNRCGGRT
jgi:hypothetical protein